jgi:hypothetical protein
LQKMPIIQWILWWEYQSEDGETQRDDENFTCTVRW